MRILALTIGLAGCAPTNDGEMQASTASDLEELARTVDASTASLGGGVDLDLTGQAQGVGDCVWTWSVSGPAAGADFASTVSAPCGGSLAGAWGSVDYAVRSGDLVGTIARADPLWTYDITGSRTADTTLTSARTGRSTTYQGDWTLDSLVGTTDGDGAGPFDARLSYEGWFGGDWAVDWSRSEDGAVSGSITGPRGRTCTVSGTTEAVLVDCP
jgi:hypothetical protein